MDPNYHYMICGDAELYFKDYNQGNCFTRLQNVSDELNTFLGEPKGTQISIANVVKRVVTYIKEKGLNDSNTIHADSSLLALLNPSAILGDGVKLTFLNLPTCLRKHLSEISPNTIGPKQIICGNITYKFYNIGTPISEAFYTYSSPDSEPDTNTDNYIEFVLNLGENTQHFELRNGTTFRVVRVLKEMAEYTSIKCCSVGEVTVDRYKAITDLTKKTLEDPTPENLAYLKEKIAFFEGVKIEEVMTPFSKEHGYWDTVCDYH
jgi:hypothetical protein